MTEETHKKDARTVGEIIDEADRMSSRTPVSISNLWTLAIFLVILAAAGCWLLFAMRFGD
jgi:hypothetical protein